LRNTLKNPSLLKLEATFSQVCQSPTIFDQHLTYIISLGQLRMFQRNNLCRDSGDPPQSVALFYSSPRPRHILLQCSRKLQIKWQKNYYLDITGCSQYQFPYGQLYQILSTSTVESNGILYFISFHFLASLVGKIKKNSTRRKLRKRFNTKLGQGAQPSQRLASRVRPSICRVASEHYKSTLP